MIKKDPTGIWHEYEKAILFNEHVELAERVKKNENFFHGKQWEGVFAPDLDKPVFNILKRVVNYFIAMLVSDNISIHLSLFNKKSDNVNRILLGAVERQAEQVMEYAKFGKLSRAVLRDAAVDGDGCLHVYFDPDVPTGWGDVTGIITAELIDNTRVFFGNPQISEPQKQPYILLESRKSVDAVREEMKRNKRPEEDLDAITTDSSAYTELDGEYLDDDKVTVITKYWRENGHIRYIKTIKNAVVKEETDPGLLLYPVTYMSWERVKNCYHGTGVIDGLIPNQMAINKMAALAQQFIRQQAFPRVLYNERKLARWEEGIRPMAVDGDPSDVLYQDRHNINMSSQVGEYLDKFIANTRDLMGASDAALGSVKPDNTSAIVAVQKSTAVPLELVKQEYYQFVEDFVRITIDQMRVFYGQRTVLAEDEEGETQEIPVDFSMLNDMVLEFDVDVGAAAYWSELSSLSTLDNLYQKGLVEPLTYLENIPDNLVPGKAQIEGDARKKIEAQQQAQEAQQQAQATQTMGMDMPVSPTDGAM